MPARPSSGKASFLRHRPTSPMPSTSSRRTSIPNGMVWSAIGERPPRSRRGRGSAGTLNDAGEPVPAGAGPPGDAQWIGGAMKRLNGIRLRRPKLAVIVLLEARFRVRSDDVFPAAQGLRGMFATCRRWPRSPAGATLRMVCGESALPVPSVLALAAVATGAMIEGWASLTAFPRRWVGTGQRRPDGPLRGPELLNEAEYARCRALTDRRDVERFPMTVPRGEMARAAFSTLVGSGSFVRMALVAGSLPSRKDLELGCGRRAAHADGRVDGHLHGAG